MTGARQLLLAAGIYTGAVALPLFVILVGADRVDRGFWVEFGVALGFIGLAMLSLQSILTARYPRLSGAIGQDTMLQFHRQAGVVAFAFVLAHPVVLLLADGDYWEFLDPRVNFLRAIFLIFTLFALPALIVTSLWRDRLRLPYEWWRLGHGALALLIVLVGLVHMSRVRHYVADGWKQALWLLIGSASIGSVLYVRAIKPLTAGRRPYRVVSVSAEADRVWTIAVEPADGAALSFRPGQFAFLTLHDSPFALEQHPFSIASSAERTDRLEFLVKELGDYTATIGSTPVGQTAYLDGPYGSMQLPDTTSPLLLVAGGIGISPILSMLRTMGDRHLAPGERRVVLLYAADSADELVHGDELDELGRRLGVEVVRVVRDPDPSGAAGHGVIDTELIHAHLPAEDASRWHVVICGPPAMMDVAERTVRRRGVPAGQVHSERFDIGAAAAVGERGTQVRKLVLALGALMVAAAVVFAL